MVPHNRTGSLYLRTYYACSSLLVVFLVVSLIWCPFVQLIMEVNTLITRVVIYFNSEILGFTSSSFSKALEAVFLCEQTLAVITGFFITCALYLASGDLLHRVASYTARLATTQTFNKVKKFALNLFEDLLSLIGNVRPQK